MFRLKFVLAVAILVSVVSGQGEDQTTPPNENPFLLVGTYGECGGIKCDNYAVCKIIAGRPQCFCADGSTGRICQVVTIKRGCNLNCKNDAVCQVGPNNQQTCVCPDGYYGKLCEYQGTPSCTYQKCFNGGVCRIDEGIRGCDCRPGYVGRFCENINWCEKKNVVCFNSGDCVNENKDFKCRCLTGFTGRFCELQTVP